MKKAFASSFLILLIAVLAGLSACSGSSPAGAAGSASKASLPAGIALAAEPAGAKPVKDVVAAARTGDEVVMVGRVGVEGSDRAYFTLVDPSLKACSETPLKDPCDTPWDFCCSPPEELAKLSALVQFRDGGELDGHLLQGNVLGFAGLDHLKSVVVKGKAEKDSSGNLTVVASGLFVR